MLLLEEKAACFVRNHGLFAGAEGIVLAVSGGADSIALLYTIHAMVSDGLIDTRLVCAHVNHQLRGGKSDGDQAFVVEQATRLGIPVVTKSADVKTHATMHRLSIETAARELRLACLFETARSQHCQWIATGHQKNDNAETIIHRLARGTGFRGLAGIRPCRQWNNGLKLASPLLDCTREEIGAYLRAKVIQWREDQTNADCLHRRNFIRHQLLPLLQSQSTGSLLDDLGSLATSAQRLYCRIATAARQAARLSVDSTDKETAIEATAITSLPPPVGVELIRQQLVELGCRERDLTRRHYQGILRLAQPQKRGKLAIPGGILACRELEKVVLRRSPGSFRERDSDPAVEPNIPGTTYFGRYRIDARIIKRAMIDGVKIKSDKNHSLEYLDLDQITWPLTVRYRRNGDRFQALGMAAETKVGKFLTAAKVPVQQRTEVLVFSDQRSILWLCPVRLGQRARVTPKTCRLLALTVTEETRPGKR